MSAAPHQAARLEPVRVHLTGALIALFPEAEREVALEARTVGEMLDGLDRRWPGMRDRLSDTSPRIRRHISIFVDGQRAELDTPLNPGSEVWVLTAMSGG